jgi:hypothetical protein
VGICAGIYRTREEDIQEEMGEAIDRRRTIQINKMKKAPY